jgi:uncharacterized protein (DUF2062 family)
MPRRLLQKIIPTPQALRERWLLRIFGERLADPMLWTLHRRAVTYAFGAGIAICFIPLPVHLLMTIPFTAVPVYYLAYRVGVAVTRTHPQHFRFVADWHWVTHGLLPVWRPFLVGCLTCAVIGGLLGWMLLEALWRYQVLSRYRTRHAHQSA